MTPPGPFGIKIPIGIIHGGNNTGISKFIFKLLSLNCYQLTIYALNLIYFSRPGGDYEFEDYPSPLHIERHMSRCLLNHNFGSSQSSIQGSSSSQGSRKSSSRKSSSSSNSIEILDPIDVVEQQAESRSLSVEEIEEILERPGDFQDAFLHSLQEPDFLPNAPTGNEVFFEGTPQVIQVFIEDEPSTSGGRRYNQRPAGRPEAYLKRKSNENQPGSSPKKTKNT